VLPITVRLHDEYEIDDVCLSIPVRVGIEGAGERLPTPMDEELRALVGFGDVLKGLVRSIAL